MICHSDRGLINLLSKTTGYQSSLKKEFPSNWLIFWPGICIFILFFVPGVKWINETVWYCRLIDIEDLWLTRTPPHISGEGSLSLVKRSIWKSKFSLIEYKFLQFLCRHTLCGMFAFFEVLVKIFIIFEKIKHGKYCQGIGLLAFMRQVSLCMGYIRSCPGATREQKLFMAPLYNLLGSLAGQSIKCNDTKKRYLAVGTGREAVTVSLNTT